MNQAQQNEGFEPLDALIALGGPVDCVAPEAIDHEELLRHAQGAPLSPAGQQHVAECGYCKNLLAEYRGIAQEPTRIGRWPLFAGVTGLAAVAAVFFMLTTTTQIATYQIAEIGGAVQQQRGGEEQKNFIFAPNSQLKVVLTPEESGDAPSHILVFGVAPDGRLRPATAEVQPSEDGEFVSYIVSGTGSGLFGNESGERQLVIYVASKKIDPLGLTVDAAQAKYDGQWFLIDARYQAGPE